MTTEEYRKKIRQQYGSKSASGNKSKDTEDDYYSDYARKVREQYAPSSTVSIDSFLQKANSYFDTASSGIRSVGYSTAADEAERRREQARELRLEAVGVERYIEKNRDQFDDKTYNTLKRYIADLGYDTLKVTEGFDEVEDFYSQFTDREKVNDYRENIRQSTWMDKYKDKSYAELYDLAGEMASGDEKNWLNSLASTREYEALKNFDIQGGEKEIGNLEKILNEYKALSRTMIDENMEKRLEYLRNNYGDEKGIKSLIAEKKQYLNRAKHLQEGITMAGVINNDDFQANSGYVSTKTDGTWNKLTSDFGMGYEDLTYEYINGEENGMRQEIINKAVSYDADTEKFFAYDHMTEDQISTYNYYYAKDGKEAAEKYLDSIQETLNYQAASERYEKMEGKTALELMFGIEAGVDQFQSGMKNLFNTEDDYIAQTAVQMVSGMVREDLADNGTKLPEWMGGASLAQAGYDAITTTSNMAPSVMTSTVLNIIAPGSGSVVGAAMMGASAAGNAYQEMLNLGYDKSQARAYSTLVGASEAGLQYLMGGISNLGGKITGNALAKMMKGIDNAFLRTALKLGGNMLSEGLEEGLQEILTPWFQNLIMHTDENVNWSEVAYSTLLGALTAGVMEGPTTIGDAVSIRNTGKQLQNADISATRLSEIGKTFSADTVAYQLAGRVDANTGAYTMGRLFNEIGATMSEQNITEITNALVAKGMDESTAKKNAKSLAYVVEGGQLTDRQIAAIEANEVLADVARTTLIDANTTWNQRTNALKTLADEMTAPKASRTNPAQQSHENTPTTDTVGTQNKEGAQSLSEAVDTSPAKVQTISKIENGQVTVKLEDGTEVNVKQADLSVDEGVRIETIAKLDGISATDANFILNTLRTNTNASAQMDSLGAREAYKYGFYGFSTEHMTTHGVFSNSLTEAQRKAIYETGRSVRQRQVEVKQATVAKNATTTNKVSNKVTGRVHFEGDRTTLTERQSASLTAMEKVADALGVQIYVFESEVNERGQRVGANGWYDPKDNSIHIDLHAGAKGEGTMLFTAAHELTHFVRQWSPAKFKTLADFLMQEYGKKGVNVDALVREQMAKAKRNGRTISYDTAYEEVVADSMEMMLADGNVMEKLAKLKAQDKSLWQKIKDFINELAAKIRAVYDGMAPDSVEGRHVAEMVDAIERLQDLFTEGLVEASENYQSSLIPGEEGVVVNENGDPVAYSTEDGSVLLSMRTYEEDGRAQLKKYLQKCVSSEKLTKEEMQEMLNDIEDIYMTCKKFKDKYAPFSSWSDATVVRDTYGKPVFSVVTPNGDYKMNLDFSLVCKKRRTLDAVFNEMSRRGIIDDFELGQKSVVKINEIIRKHGLETACALCFVDAKRFRQASMADSFTKLYNELVLSLVPEAQRSSIDHFNFSGYETIKKVEDGIHTWDKSKLDFSHLDEVMKNYGKGTVEHKAAKYIKSHAEGRRLLLRGDFMSSQGFDAVKTQNKDILKLYNSKKGTGGPKAAFGDVQYMNEIIKKAKSWTPAKAYAVGGVRIQSFSDYVPRMVFDYVQMIYDLAATKLPAHAYTKESLFVKQFGLTGVKINMSLIPAIAEGGVAPGLDANGNYVWAGESFDFETAKEIQNAEGYTENCGTICVGVSDRHIRKLLSDPDIRMVIPYHKSGLNPIVAHMNKIAEFTDYTNKQNTTVKGTGAKAEKHFDFNKALHDMGENADPRAVIQQYFDWCDDNGYDPKFADFRDHPNYYKLIEDFTLYDKDGKYVPQREVMAVFPKEGSAFGSMKELIEAGLEEDAVIEGKRDSSLNSIVDEIQKTIPRTEAEIAEEQVAQADKDLEADVKYSDRDSDGNQLSKEQQAFFKHSKVRDNDGNLKVMYHGTSKGGYTVFDPWGKGKYGLFGVGIYFTDSKNIAESYTKKGKGTSPQIYEAYLNITNPINMDAQADSIAWKKRFPDATFPESGTNEDFYRAMEEYFEDEGYVRWEAEESAMYALDDMGYDGITHIGGGRVNPDGERHQVYIAFTPEQVKNTSNINPTDNPDIRYSDRDTESVSNRSLLANAFDGVAQNDIERKKIQEYKGKISLIESEEHKLQKLNEQIKDLSFSKGQKDIKAIRDLQFEAKQTANRISTYDKQILTLEASKPLQSVLQREKKMAYQRAEKKGKEALEAYREKTMKYQQELVDKWEESRKRGIESRQKADMRQKIRKAIRELDKILNHGDKKKNVKEEMKGLVSSAIQSAEVLFTDNYSNEDILRNGFGVQLGSEEKKHYAEAKKILDSISELGTGYEVLAKREELNKKLSYRMAKLREAFYRERNRLNETRVSEVLSSLADAYYGLQSSETTYIKDAYHASVHEYLKYLQNEVGGTTVRDMNMSQLESLNKAYTMVLETVRNANKMFNEKLKESRDQLANAVMREVKKAGGDHGDWSKLGIKFNQFSWNNMKPIYAAERIGSETFSRVVSGLFDGQYKWATTMEKSREFQLQTAKKYKVNNWDMEKTYKFSSSNDLELTLNLEQILALYAYSKREAAHDHITSGGVVFGKNTEVKVEKLGIKVTRLKRSATTYSISDTLLGEIISKLDDSQKKYVDEMQKYLSETMGGLGNEVSMRLYGVKLFGEENYFPLRSAGQYMEKAREADLQKQQGHTSLVNSGFTHAVKPHAKNPIVLDGFMDVWAGHVNEMAMYNGMVLPMEDFRKVYNYHTPFGDGSTSVNGVIENAYGAEATGYFDQLYQELNSGAVSDPRETDMLKWVGKFKKAAVMMSASVVMQQPSAIGRAFALIDPKYFVGQRISESDAKKQWDEVKKYAPVAIIKEMGGFDTHTGSGAKDFLLAKEYSKDEIAKALKDKDYLKEKANVIMGYLPAKADELTWVAIWKAVKREVRAKNSNLHGEAFLKKAGERFSEVIEKTQVYDSVLAKSANMRAKTGLMTMATAFLAEPTTTVNMLENAILYSKKNVGRVLASVVTSIILNNFLSSWPYAMRDDDEDETWWEKYAEAFISGMVDDLNPITYYPFLKDVWSIFQGYDVERSDMSIISDVSDALKKALQLIGKDTSNMDEDELAEYHKTVWSAILSLADGAFSALGVPFKNARREVESWFNASHTLKNGLSYNRTSLLHTIADASLDALPVASYMWKTEKSDRLYDAILSGNTAYVDRLRSEYDDEKQINNAIRKGLRENDSRIYEAALAQINGHPEERVKLQRQVIADGFKQDDVVAATNTVINKLSPSASASEPKKKGLYSAEDFALFVANGKASLADEAKKDIIATHQLNGKTADEAEKSFQSSAKTDLKEMFLAGTVTVAAAEHALKTYCGMDAGEAKTKVNEWTVEKKYGFAYDDKKEAYLSGKISYSEMKSILMNVGGKDESIAEEDIAEWEYEAEHPDLATRITYTKYKRWQEEGEPYGVSVDMFTDVAEFRDDGTSESVKSQEEVAAYINSLPISSSQKDALWCCFWKESTLKKAPWR